ncbi:hypothetical protein P154DRAFT_520080 [Amniculicola lignicola CBS 123094]|uniref:Uncharacterized protein n=1 Tax=Amniculicola lignicola CBS 123094 TaxID=1392246 RepID=A0A6A5WQX6_9PLEO|nr:hypothetical protein P154DRAFT_520080 [Amniculicola lignicola CBS 123094]
MNSAIRAGRTTTLARAWMLPGRVAEGRIARRLYATEPPPTSQPPPPPPTGERQPQTRAGTFYKSFGSPILKCFLGALFTYQVTYWTWMKLESVEVQKDYQGRSD